MAAALAPGLSRSERTDRAEALRLACPEHPSVLLTLALRRFEEGDTLGAREVAELRVRLTPDDASGWTLLAPLRYLTEDRMGAFAAWNRVGRPRVDAVVLRREAAPGGREGEGTGSPSGPLAQALRPVAPGALLTPLGVEAASRRVSALPRVERVRLDPRILDGGLARVEVHTLDREGPGIGRTDLPGHLLRGVTRTLSVGHTAGEVRMHGAGVFTPSVGEVRGAIRVPALGLPEVGAEFQALELQGRSRRIGVRVEAADWPHPLPGPGIGPPSPTPFLQLRSWLGVERESLRENPGTEVGGGVGITLTRDDGPARLGARLRGEGWTRVGARETAPGEATASGAAREAGGSREAGGARFDLLLLGRRDTPRWSFEATGGGVVALAPRRGDLPLHLRPRFGSGAGATHLLRGMGGAEAAPVAAGRASAGWITGGMEAVRWAPEGRGPGPLRWVRMGGAGFVDAARGVRGGGVDGRGLNEAGTEGWRITPGVGFRMALPGADGTLAMDLALDLAPDRAGDGARDPALGGAQRRLRLSAGWRGVGWGLDGDR